MFGYGAFGTSGASGSGRGGIGGMVAYIASGVGRGGIGVMTAYGFASSYSPLLNSYKVSEFCLSSSITIY